jgi:hypothetical protein
MEQSENAPQNTRVSPSESFIEVKAPVHDAWVALAIAVILFGSSVGVASLVGRALDAEVGEPHRVEPSDEEMELVDEYGAAGIDVMSERGATLLVPKGTATKVTCGGTSAHKSWLCKSRTPASLIWRGGSNVNVDGGTGTVWCDGTVSDDCVDDVITGDTAHAYLYTKVDAGVTLGCSCAYQ